MILICCDEEGWRDGGMMRVGGGYGGDGGWDEVG